MRYVEQFIDRQITELPPKTIKITQLPPIGFVFTELPLIGFVFTELPLMQLMLFLPLQRLVESFALGLNAAGNCILLLVFDLLWI
jgi:hypothetical protein